MEEVAKRSRSLTEPEAPEQAPERDPVIGLDVGGRRFYCHLTTLTNMSGSMLAARFGSASSLPPGDLVAHDDLGRPIYFIDRDPTLFEHVLSFMRTGKVPWQLPPFALAPGLWRALRDEAAYYGLDALASLLDSTHQCHFLHTGDREGVLYWLGRDRGRREEYRNPCSLGVVRVVSSDDLAPLKTGISFHSEEERAAFVQHSPPVEFVAANSLHTIPRVHGPQCSLLWCGDNCGEADSKWAAVDLLSVRLRPTHYTLCYDTCFGMNAWNFSASVDGERWDILHQPRGEKYLLGPSDAELQLVDDETAAMAIAQRHRHTWHIEPEPSGFYRFFRISGIGDAELSSDIVPCLHCCGMELYGDVREG